MKTLLSFAMLVVVVASALAQQSPPGGPGPGYPGGAGGPGGPPSSQGSWVLQYKGTVYDKDGRTVWSRAQYAASANDYTREVQWMQSPDGDVYGIGAWDLQNVHGTISVRRHWVGSGAPTPGRNFRIRSYANALAVYLDPADAHDASANNGFEGDGGPSATADGIYLVQPGEGSDGDTTVSFSTSGEKASFFVGAAFDNRSARIELAGAEDSKKVQLTGNQVPPFPIPDADEPKTVQWAEAVPVSVSETLDGANWSKTISVGLSEGKSTITTQFGGYHTEDVDPFTNLSYSALVSQSRIPNETYDFSCDYTSASETLPTLTWTGYDGWNILGVSDVRANPKVIVRDGDFDTEQTGDIGQTAKANLKYTWADGLKAKAKLNVVLRRGAEQVADLAVVRCTSWSAAPETVPLKGGTAPAGNGSWTFTEVPTPEVYKWSSNVLSVGGKLIPWKPAAIACTIYNLFLPYVTPPAVEGQFPRRAAIDTSLDTVDWGNLTPGLTYDVASFDWKASTIPQRDDHWIVVDRYGIGGSIERAPMLAGTKVRTHIQRTENTRRYHWIYVGPGA